jgi:hypothetical protein
MGTDLSDNYVTVEISTHVDTTFFNQSKEINSQQKLGKRFVGHPVYAFFVFMSHLPAYRNLLHATALISVDCISPIQIVLSFS